MARLEVMGNVCADFAGDLDKRKSTKGYVSTLGGKTTSWKSMFQPIMT